jgi:iron(III) transport system ATP-binding protein
VTTLSISGVCKSFGALEVLHDVDLEVADGALTAILGPSGSGKTTLLRIIAGFERVDRGVVRIGDATVDDGEHYVPPERRRIGYVPQEGALFPHLTVIANVGFGLPRRERRGPAVHELIEMVGLAGLEGRYPHQLSGGQQQRVALARALTIEPELVLLDEPFASLDASLRSTVRADVVHILRAAGTTAVLVTHDQDEAFSMADRLAIIRTGRITPTAAPQEFYAHPLDPDMAAFVGEANLLRGTIDGAFATTMLGRVPIRGAAPASTAESPDSDAPDSDGSDSGAAAPIPATVLVRPEQIDVCDASESGLAARVVHRDYHGHDALLTIRPLGPAGEDSDQLIVARVEGNRALTRDAAVTIRVHGSVLAWPEES